MSDLLPPGILLAAVPYMLPHVTFALVLILTRRWLSPRTRLATVGLVFLAILAGIGAWAYFQTKPPWTPLKQGVAAAEVYAFGLGLVWAGVAMWRRGSSAVAWRFGALAVWAMTLPSLPLTELMFFCANDRYSCP
jgi:hypothetical protein